MSQMDKNRRTSQTITMSKAECMKKLASAEVEIEDLKRRLEATAITTGSPENKQHLQQTLDLLNAVTEGTNVIVAAVDTNFRYTFFNRAYQEELMRLTGKDIQIGMSMLD